MAGALLTGFAASAAGQSDPSPASPLRLDTVVVTGLRASLVTAERLRRDQLGVSEAIVADDVQKLPDFSLTDALQRVSGIQIARDRGDGTGLSLRGLVQVETTLNGREVFTAGSGRGLDFADIPAEMLAAVEVHKTASAPRVEGGLGGTIDLRTRRPFDFTANALAFSMRGVRGDLAGHVAPQVSALGSGRWRLDGAGEFGALLSWTLQRRGWREDQKSAGNPLARTDLVAGETVFVPNGSSESASRGTRERRGTSLVLQWRPSERFETTAEHHQARLLTLQDTEQINLLPGTGFEPGSVALFPGTRDVSRITWTDAPISVLSFARDTLDRVRQSAVGARWNDDAWTWSADLSRTASSNSLYFSGPVLGTTAARFTHDLGSRTPSTSVSGTDLLDPANYRVASVADRRRPFDGVLRAGRIDAEWRPAHGGVESVAAGLRLARRSAGNAPGLVIADATVPAALQDPAALPGSLHPNATDDFLSGAGGTSVSRYLVGNLDAARNPGALRSAYGITAPIPAGGSALGLWRIDEHSLAGYLNAGFGVESLGLQGEAGLRVVRTDTAVAGARSVPATGGTTPVDARSRGTDALPSIALRFALTPSLDARVAASKTLTRPDFNQLSPSVTLVRNPVTPSLNVGGAGNPELRAVRSRNLDAALDHRIGAHTTLRAGVFLKKVDGFVATVSRPEVYDGETYQVSRPENSTPVDLRGVELGAQSLFDRLPPAWRGLGMQANYTLVDGDTPSLATGERVPLQNLSKHSANLVGFVEREGWQVRLAYHWRNRFPSGTVSVVGEGTQTVYTRAYGWLDGSVRWRLDREVWLSIEGLNLLNTVRRSELGTATRPQSVWRNDRQVAITLSFRL